MEGGLREKEKLRAKQLPVTNMGGAGRRETWELRSHDNYSFLGPNNVPGFKLYVSKVL